MAAKADAKVSVKQAQIAKYQAALDKVRPPEAPLTAASLVVTPRRLRPQGLPYRPSLCPLEQHACVAGTWFTASFTHTACKCRRRSSRP